MPSYIPSYIPSYVPSYFPPDVPFFTDRPDKVRTQKIPPPLNYKNDT